MTMEFSFPAEDEIESTHKPQDAFPPVEDGDEFWAIARLEDGEPVYRSGMTQSNKPRRSYQFTIVDDPIQEGRWLSLFLVLDGGNYFFRKHVSAITGVDLSQGARMNDTILQEKIGTQKFRVKVKNNKQYLNIDEIVDRVDYTPDEGPKIPVAVGGDSDGDPGEDDIPF